uniref:Serine aminopeptidase S33 domain-containing protein n=1 Tax=Oryza punctata TaxID=4537 RepID=A0A0E0JHT2_ORYPU
MQADHELRPTWRPAFSRGNMPDRSFKVPWKRAVAVASPRRTTAPRRAPTARGAVQVPGDQEVELPLLATPGARRSCTAAPAARTRRCGCTPGMWHQLVGEPEENVERLFGDVLDWFKSHAAAAAAAAARGEGQQ